jgi:HEAT repeat protein
VFVALGEAAIPTLTQLLTDHDTNVQRMAASTLSRMGKMEAPALPILIARLRRPEREDRELAALSISRIGPPAIERLIEALLDPDPRLRGGAARALELMGTHALSALPALIATMPGPGPSFDPSPPRQPSSWTRREEPVPHGHYAAIKAIGPLAVPALLEQLDSRDHEARVRAVRAIGFLGHGGRTAVPRLIGLLSHRDMRLEAAKALGGIGAPARAATPMLVSALKNCDPAYRARAAETLGRIVWLKQMTGQGTQALAQSLLAPLKAVLQDREPVVRAAAALALRDLGGTASSAIPELRRLLRDPDADVRLASLQALPRLGRLPPSLRRAIAERLKDPDCRVRLAATKSISDDDFTSEGVISGLLSELNDTDPDVRAEAAQTLARNNGKLASGDSRTLVRSSIAARTLQAALSDTDPRVRAGVAYTLPVFKQDAAASVPLLVGRLKDPSAVVRFGAAVALGQFEADARPALPALFEALADPGEMEMTKDHSVSTKAARAILSISPKDQETTFDRLFTLLLDPRESVREASAQTLGEFMLSVELRLYRALADAKTPRPVKSEILSTLSGGRLRNGWNPGRNVSRGPEARAAIPALRELAQDSHKDVRDDAGRLLVLLELKVPSKVQAILDAGARGLIELHDVDELHIEEPASSDVLILIKGLKDPDEDVRTLAAYALAAIAGKLPCSDGSDLRSDQSAPEETQARARLLDLKKEAIDVLIPMLRDSDTQVRWAVAWALGELASGEKQFALKIIPGLIAIVRDQTTRVPEGGSIFEGNGSFDGCLSSHGVGNAKHEKLRIAAIQVLGLFLPEAAVAVPDLVDALLDGDQLVRWHTACALGQIGPAAKAAVPALIDVLRSKPAACNDAVRTAPGVLTLPPGAVQVMAAGALGRIGPDAIDAVPALVEALDDRDPDLRFAAAGALEGIGPGSDLVVPALARAICNGVDETLADRVAQALAAFGKESIPALLTALRDRDPDVRYRAAKVLGELEAIPQAANLPLQQALNDPDPDVRETIAEALKQIRPSGPKPVSEEDEDSVPGPGTP